MHFRLWMDSQGTAARRAKTATMNQMALLERMCSTIMPRRGIVKASLPMKLILLKVTSCDMLFASPRLVVAEAIVMKEEGADAVIPVNKHGYEPFHAMYNRAACLPAIEELLAQGDKRAQSFFGKVGVRKFTQSEVLAAEPMGGCFINANTPEELHALEEAFVEE